jgi:hypothetical protein
MKPLPHAQRIAIYQLLRLLDRAPLPLGPTVYREVRIVPWKFSTPLVRP